MYISIDDEKMSVAVSRYLESKRNLDSFRRLRFIPFRRLFERPLLARVASHASDIKNLAESI